MLFICYAFCLNTVSTLCQGSLCAHSMQFVCYARSVNIQVRNMRLHASAQFVLASNLCFMNKFCAFFMFDKCMYIVYTKGHHGQRIYNYCNFLKLLNSSSNNILTGHRSYIYQNYCLRLQILMIVFALLLYCQNDKKVSPAEDMRRKPTNRNARSQW